MVAQPDSTRQAPGPEGRFLFGKSAAFQRDTLRLLLELQRDYGGIVRLRLGPYLVHQVTDPSLVKHVLQDRADNYVRGRFYRRFNLFFGRGMLTTDDDEWRQRRAVSQPFFTHGAVDAAAPLITDSVANLLERWAAPAAKGEPLDVVPDIMRLAMGVLSRLLFHVDLRERADDLLPVVRFAIGTMILTGKLEQVLPSWLPTRYQRNLRSSRAALNTVMDDVIDSHPGDGDDLVAALLAASDPATGRPWDRRQIRAELKTHFLAGHETTGCGLAWTLYAIAGHADVQQRLSDEIDEVLGGGTPAPADLPRLEYLGRVVDESLRLYPPIWLFPRDARHDDELDGYHIPADSTLLLAPYAAHHDPGRWPDPETFDPDRFCPGRPGPARYTYFPFGGGPRRCIGSHLARLELQLAVAMIMQRYRLRLSPEHQVIPAALVSLRPLHGIHLTLSDRYQGVHP
jgi:cytochrome P450